MTRDPHTDRLLHAIGTSHRAPKVWTVKNFIAYGLIGLVITCLVGFAIATFAPASARVGTTDEAISR